MKRLKRTICGFLTALLLTGMSCGGSAENISSSDRQTFYTVPTLTRVVVDGIVHSFDVYTSNGAWYLSASDAKTAFGETFSEDYVELSAYAEAANIRYTQDETLMAAYFCTWEPYAEANSLAGFESYAEKLSLPLDRLEQETISGQEMAEILDCFVSHEAPEQKETWDAISVNLRTSQSPLSRSDMLSSLFLASWVVGGSYMDYSKESSMNLRDAAFDGENDRRDWSLFSGVPIPDGFDVGYGFQDHYGCGACIFNIGTVSPVDGSYPLFYDGISFRYSDNASYLNAVLAVLRVFSTGELKTVSIDDLAVCKLNGCFSDELLAKTAAPAAVTADNHPQWTGFVLSGELGNNLHDIPEQMALCANWGFNSVRLNLEYEQIFNRDVTQADLAALSALDLIVAQAVKYNLHLNIVLISLPGRWRSDAGEFDTFGEFDLFLNEEKQAQAKRIFTVLAQRYQGISSDYLSFTPVFEANNQNLSTGESAEPYTYTDYAASLVQFINVIHAIDPERLIMVETEVAEFAQPVYQALEDRENILFSCNFVEAPFVYACMTAVTGADIDHENSSHYLVHYPINWYRLDNCIVDPEMESLRDAMPEGAFDGSASLQISGFLPAGTTVDLYLSQAYGGHLEWIADGEILYTEELGNTVYEVGESVSGRINYAVSNKKIAVTLPKDTALLEIAVSDGALTWSGMDLWLPEEYAQERWYYASAYDVFRGLEDRAGIALKNDSRVMVWPYEDREMDLKENQLVIHEDLTYSTPTIREAASADTILSTVQAIGNLREGVTIRYERADFGGVIWTEMMEYYEDMYRVLNEYKIGWWSNDWWVMTNDMSEEIVGIEQTSYGSYACFDLNLLRLMQQYQNNARP